MNEGDDPMVLVWMWGIFILIGILSILFNAIKGLFIVITKPFRKTPDEKKINRDKSQKKFDEMKVYRDWMREKNIIQKIERTLSLRKKSSHEVYLKDFYIGSYNYHFDGKMHVNFSISRRPIDKRFKIKYLSYLEREKINFFKYNIYDIKYKEHSEWANASLQAIFDEKINDVILEYETDLGDDTCGQKKIFISKVEKEFFDELEILFKWLDQKRHSPDWNFQIKELIEKYDWKVDISDLDWWKLNRDFGKKI